MVSVEGITGYHCMHVIIELMYFADADMYTPCPYRPMMTPFVHTE